MKPRYKKGGKIKPKKKRTKEYTDRAKYEEALKAYNDSLMLNQYYQLQEELEPEDAYDIKELGLERAREMIEHDIMTGTIDTTKYQLLKDLGNEIIEKSEGRIQWANPDDSPDLQYYDYSDDEENPFLFRLGNQLKNIVTNDDEAGAMFYGGSKVYFGDALNAVWDEPQVKPVFVDMEAKKKKGKKPQKQPDYQKRVDSVQSNPDMFIDYFREQFGDIYSREEPFDTTYFDDHLNRYINYGLFSPDDPRAQTPDGWTYHDYLDIQQPSSVQMRKTEPIMKLKPKGIPTFQVPQLQPIDPRMKIYGRRLNQRTGEYIYDTDRGTVKKKIGREDAAFYNQNRAAIEQMRRNR